MEQRRSRIDYSDLIVLFRRMCKSNWSTRQLERQINSFYYQRLLSSQDLESVRNEIQALADVIVIAKDNNINSLRQVKRITNKKEPIEVWENEKGFESVRVLESTFKMDKVEQDMRFVKFAMKHKDGKHSQIMIVTTCLNMSMKTLFKMIRARWDIENCIFNNLKEHYGLDHCYVHGGNSVEAVLYLIFITANILQLFLCRRLRRNYETQKEMVRLIVNGFIKMQYLPELVFKGLHILIIYVMRLHFTRLEDMIFAGRNI